MPVVVVYFHLHSDHFFGYQHGHLLKKVFSYQAHETSSVMELAEAAYQVFNTLRQAPSEVRDD